MTDRRGVLILLAVFTSILTGCTHFHEDRAITAFTEALNAGDLQTMRDATSVQFKSKALRRAEAMDDLEILGLPDAAPSIVEVKDVSETKKEVTVTTATGQSELLYSLVLEPISKKWVVDDVFTRQQQTGITVAKPITEQMDLLLTIRDFLDAWDADSRNAVLNVTTAEFKETLSKLPAPWLARVTQRVVGDDGTPSTRKHRPHVAVDGREAVVQLPTSDGKLRLSMELGDNGWKVADVAILARREGKQIGSVKNHARVILAGTQFTEAFRSADRMRLKSATTEPFYQQALQNARLSQVTLPDITLAPTDYEVKATIDHASMLVPTEAGAFRIEFKRFDDPLVASKATYRVKEASLYDATAKNEVRLSSLFTAEQRVNDFVQAMQTGRLKQLKNVSSTDFANKVWSRANGLPLQLLPLGPVAGKVVRTDDTRFEGSQTFVTVSHAGGTARYELTDAGGRLVIDDILVDRDGKQVSLKRDLEVSIPILKFAGAFQTNQVSDLQRVCSRDFSRRVWDRADAVPESDLPILSHLTKPISDVQKRSGRAMVALGEKSQGAIVTLVEENQHWVIDDVEIVTGITPSQHVQLKPTLTESVAQDRLRNGSARMLAGTGSRSRKRFNLARKDVPQSARVQTGDRSSNETQPGTSAAETIQQVAAFEPDVAAINQASGDSSAGQGVRHAFHVTSPDGAKGVSHASKPVAPSVLDVPATASRMAPGNLTDDWAPGGPTQPAPLQPAQAEPIPSDRVDVAALFEPQPRLESGTAEMQPAPRSVKPAVSGKAMPIVSSVPAHDAGRVTDPSLQPIRIPR